jgi:hypothetical protein
MSDADTLNALEREQRKAYWKGEETAARRLPQFLPQDPLSGASLRESERIEEAVFEAQETAWTMQVEADNLSAITGDNKGPHGVRGRAGLEWVNKRGGELSPQAVDDWVDELVRETGDPSLYDRPSYEKKAMFYNWVRKMESWDTGVKPPDTWKQQETRDDKAMREFEQTQTPDRSTAEDKSLKLDQQISADSLPDSIGVG